MRMIKEKNKRRKYRNCLAFKPNRAMYAGLLYRNIGFEKKEGRMVIATANL